MLPKKCRPIAYASTILNLAEQNYWITKKGCLVVLWVLNMFHYYFNEMLIKVTKDHSALTNLTNGNGLWSKMVRWSLELDEYNVFIEHMAGKEN